MELFEDIWYYFINKNKNDQNAVQYDEVELTGETPSTPSPATAVNSIRAFSLDFRLSFTPTRHCLLDGMKLKQILKFWLIAISRCVVALRLAGWLADWMVMGIDTRIRKEIEFNFVFAVDS